MISHMSIIINTSNLVKGGALQVALSFLNELKEFGKDKYHVFLSKSIELQLDVDSYPHNFRFYSFEASASSLRHRYSVVKRLKYLEKKIVPDVVFTVFGPAFWRPKAPHLMGFALGWAIYHDTIAFKRLAFFEKIKKCLRHTYMLHHFRREGNVFVVEAEHVRKRLSDVLKIDLNKVHVVSNSYNKFFESFTESNMNFLPHKEEAEVRLLALGANYPHKNFGIIKEVTDCLRTSKSQIKFILTLPEEEFKREFSGYENWIVNIGPIQVKDCPQLYSECDALFLPTLLECFTASYPEAMKMEKPILTSDLWFAHDICGDAAEYFDPLKAKDIANKIVNLIANPVRQNELIEFGRKELNKFPNSSEKAKQYLEICSSMVKK